jgi:hypothetical protein
MSKVTLWHAKEDSYCNALKINEVDAVQAKLQNKANSKAQPFHFSSIFRFYWACGSILVYKSHRTLQLIVFNHA